jgi:hypothetical protein
MEIVIHFGINPKSGGRPPSDRRRIMEDDFNGILFLTEFDELKYRIINRGIVIIEYMVR